MANEAWDAFAAYAQELGLDPSIIQQGNYATLPDSWYSPLYNQRPTSDAIMQDFIMDPSYNFRFGEGQRAIERAAAAQGKRFSGNVLAELTDYGQRMASQEYGNQWNRMSSIAGYGPTMAGTQGQIAYNTGAGLADTYSGLGAAGANQALSAGQSAVNQYSTLGKLFGGTAANMDWNKIFGS